MPFWRFPGYPNFRVLEFQVPPSSHRAHFSYGFARGRCFNAKEKTFTDISSRLEAICLGLVPCAGLDSVELNTPATFKHGCR